MSVVDATFDFGSVEYRPIRERTSEVDALEVRCEALVLRPAAPDENERIHSWLRREELHRAFGLLHPPRRQDVERRELPDGTGEVESVEFLVIRDAARKPVALSICYEFTGRGDPNQAVDMGLLAPADVGGHGPVRTIRLLILTYLFAVCGALSVSWNRRRRVRDSDDTPHRSPAGAHAAWRTSAMRRTVSRDQFLAIIARRSRSERGREMPLIYEGAWPNAIDPPARSPHKAEGDGTDG